MINSESIHPDDRLYYETVCYGKYVEVSCDYGRPAAVDIVQAKYGRMSVRKCPSTHGLRSGCVEDLTTKLQNKFVIGEMPLL